MINSKDKNGQRLKIVFMVDHNELMNEIEKTISKRNRIDVVIRLGEFQCPNMDRVFVATWLIIYTIPTPQRKGRLVKA